MKIIPSAVLFLLITAGCKVGSSTNDGSLFSEGSGRSISMENSCNLPFGTLFADCISESWRLSYWRTPLHGEGGREVHVDEESDHYVQVQVLASQSDGRGPVLDIQYAYKPANASLRFKTVNESSGFADLSQFSAGSLQFDVRVLDWGFASGLSMNVECGWPCTSEPINIPIAPVGEWRRVEVPASMLADQGLDLTRVDSAINLSPTWNVSQGMHYQLDNVRWVEDLALKPLQIEGRNWSRLARIDLDFIYQTAIDSHPGAIDDRNPEFREYLDRGYEQAVASLADIHTAQDYADVIHHYMDGFDDGHFQVGFHRLPNANRAIRSSLGPSRNSEYYTHLASIERLNEGIYWVYLPSFSNEQGPEEVQAMEEVIAALAEVPGDATVVFDVRWHDGGNEEWGRKILGGLYRPSFVRRLLVQEGALDFFAEFRVSEGNAKYHRRKAAAVGPGGPGYDVALSRYEGIQNALEDGDDWHSAEQSALLTRLVGFWYSIGSVESSVTPVLVTSGGCASACLGFADLVLRLPNVRHLGHETGSDTLYLDVRVPRPTLPSGLGQLTLPMKVWRDRFRRNHESYVPELIYPGDIADTEAVRQWVLESLQGAPYEFSKAH